jgi:hypothetical protein
MKSEYTSPYKGWQLIQFLDNPIRGCHESHRLTKNDILYATLNDA